MLLPASAAIANHDQGNGKSQDHLHRKNHLHRNDSSSGGLEPAVGGPSVGATGAFGGVDVSAAFDPSVRASGGLVPTVTVTGAFEPSVNIVAVPGPSSAAMLTVGVAAWFVFRRRRY